ncbi:MAG: MFS transporter [Mycobacteriales bacterium]
MRQLVWGRAVSALGDGLWYTIWAIYVSRVVGLSATAVGAGMAVAAGAGLAAAVPLGALADRADPRWVLVVATSVRALAMVGYLLVRGPLAFVLVSTVFVGLSNGSSAVRTALVAGLVRENAARVRALAQQRVAQHVGYAVGAGAGALVLSAGRPGAYSLAIAANAASFAVLAVATATVPAPTPVRAPRAAGPEWTARAALTDRPYLAVVAVTAVLSLCWAMMSTGLPLWISRGTRLPLALSGAVVVISSAGIAALQVPISRLARTAPRAARTAVWSGTALAGSCVLLASTAGGSGTVAVGVVLAAALLHVAGELGYVAASWGLSISLMREEARGAYQGVSEAATATVQVVGPAVFTAALGGFGAGGWLLVAALFAAAATPVPALTRRALRTRERSVAARATPAGAILARPR